MPDFYFISDTVSTTSGSILANMGGDAGAWTVVGADATLVEGSTDYVITGTGNNQVVQILGAIAAPDYTAIRLDGFSSEVYVAEGGSILSEAIAIYLSTNARSSDVVNHGSIIGSYGIYVGADNVSIQNTGEISATYGGNTLVTGGAITTAINFYDAEGDYTPTVRVSNSGILTGHYSGNRDLRIALDASYAYNSTTFDYSAVNLEFDNTGVLNGGVLNNWGDARVDNSGVIHGDVDLANYGTVENPHDNDSVTNSGTIQGDVLLGAEADSYEGVGQGLVTGWIMGGTGNDVLRGAMFQDRMDGGKDADTLNGRDGHDTLLGDDGNDKLYGGRGDDSLDGGQGGDLLYGGAGDDTISGGAGTGWDWIWGGDGHDDVDLGDGNDRAWLGAGDDTVLAGAGNDEVYGGAGDDLIEMSGGADTARGGAGDDTIRAGGGGPDELFGGTGNDLLDATGGYGWDVLDGGQGDDTMTGGDGNDRFVFRRNAGHDEITDFQNDADRLDLSAFGTNYSKLAAAGAFSGDAGTTVIDLSVVGGVGTITLLGFDLADLNFADFVF